MKFQFVSILIRIILIIISKLIFDKIYNTSKIIIDEAFHIHQGVQYCQLNFTSWDPKITTLPGLYIISTVLLSPFNACSVYWLRLISYLASIVNYIIIFSILQIKRKNDQWKNLFLATNLYILPPLFFFGNLYYTDTISTTFILLAILLFKMELVFCASLAAYFSVIVRQNNVIWVGMLFVQYCILEVYAAIKKRKTYSDFSFDDFKVLLEHLKRKKIKVFVFSLSTWCNIFSFLAIFLSFTIFIILNRGIVVGDKSAHVASIHFMQMFYYFLFLIFFTWPLFLSEIKHFFSFALKYKSFSFLITIFITLVVYLNTEIHPYLLADNRHYTFYIWNRFFKKKYFRYLIVPVYYFGSYCFFKKLNFRNDFIKALTYSLSTFLILTSQKMIEIRYFLIPYLIFRINIHSLSYWQLIVEFIFYITINFITLSIFFTKDIYWVDFDYPQKLIW